VASISATTAAIAAIVATAASTSVAVYGQVAAAENAKETADYNAEMQRRAALDASQRGSADAADKRQETRRMIARQHAIMGGSGFDPNSGTNLSLMTETAGQGELDALKIRNNAARTAAGLNAQADLTTAQGDAALSAGQMNAGGTILSGLANMGLAAYKMNNPPPKQ
jgi:hypothetical protein